MLIKSIKIHGFKSFYNEVGLALKDGISAIVGPNGCGKSNILDAIRWTLGEQNPRKLRGNKMEDLLFNGSEHFPPSGMARVSIQLSPLKGSFPQPYSEYEELCLERILYRSGESEYRLNQNIVRLKDILDLFMDTGTGTRGYSIIPQGLVGEIISASAEQRRLFIEEAAGIVKYKTRKVSAVRKMEATRDNLRHIEAILSEIKRQVNALKRQAQKARRSQELKEEVRRTECQLASWQFQAFLRSEREHERLREQREQSLTSCLTELAREEAEIEQIRIDLIQHNRLSDENRAKLAEQVQERNRIAHRQLYLRQSLEDLERSLEEGRQALATYREQLLTAQGEDQETSRRLEEISAKSASIEGELSCSRQSYDELVSRERELLEDLETVKVSLFSCLSRKAEIHNKQVSLQEKSRHLAQRMERTVREMEVLQEENEGLSRKQQEVSALCQSLKRQRAFLLLQRAALENFQRELRLEVEALTREVEGLQTVLHRKASRLLSLEDLQRTYEGCQDGVRAIMQRREGSGECHPGVLGMVADVIETEPEFETALESALGDRLQYIIVEEQERGLEAVEYLKRGTLGRGSFIPLELRGQLPRKDVADAEAMAFPMMDVIRVKDGYDKVADYLLGDVVLVPDLQAGLQLWRKNGRHDRIVTRDGDMIDPWGVISGGKANGDAAATLFKTRREIRDLKKEVEELDEQLRRKKDSFDLTLRKVKVCESDLGQLQQGLYALDMEILKAEKDFQQADDSHKRNAQKLTVLAAESRDFQQEAVQWTFQETSSVQEQEELIQQEACEERRLSELSEAAAILAREKEEKREDLSRLNVEAQLLRERWLSLAARHTELEQRVEQLRNASLQREKRCEEDLLRRATFAEESQENERELLRIEALSRQLEEVLSRLAETIAAETSSVQSREHGVRSLGKSAEELRAARDEIQLKLVEVGLRRKNIQEQIWEKYRIDVAQECDAAAGDLCEAEVRQKLDGLHAALESLGEVDPAAIEEFEELQARHAFYQDQHEDLRASLDSLQRLIQRINRITRSRFLEAFEGINQRFQQVFPKLFNGGKAFLRLEEDKSPLEAGVEIVAQPPGKKLQNINLLSGGEKSLAALSLILAIFQFKPSPFCILDEVDAALDDVNVNRFNEILREIAKVAQFIVITHNKQTMETADSLYGVTMQSPGVSGIVSVRLN
ncbi:MAG: chromosome segregation protein SMC [bacterium]